MDQELNPIYHQEFKIIKQEGNEKGNENFGLGQNLSKRKGWVYNCKRHRTKPNIPQ